MTVLLSYLCKVIICSAVLYGYYYVALRNNRFHQWNRYYLVLITILSLLTPLLNTVIFSIIFIDAVFALLYMELDV